MNEMPDHLIDEILEGNCVAIGSNALGGGMAAGFDYSTDD